MLADEQQTMPFLNFLLVSERGLAAKVTGPQVRMTGRPLQLTGLAAVLTGLPVQSGGARRPSDGAAQSDDNPTRAGYCYGLGAQQTNFNEASNSNEHLSPLLNDFKDTLSEAEYKAASKLVHDYADVFSRSEFDLGRTEALPHRIDTGDSRPIKQPLRRHPKILEDFIDEQVQKMLANSPVVFQRLMSMVLAGLAWQTCLVYIDDIIVVGKTFDEHLRNVAQVLGRLREAGLKLKLSKCKLFCTRVKFFRAKGQSQTQKRWRASLTGQSRAMSRSFTHFWALFHTTKALFRSSALPHGRYTC